MRIGFDATLLRNGFFTGIEKYVINFLKTINEKEIDFEFYVFIQDGFPDFLKKELNNLNLIHLHSANRIILDQILIPLHSKKLNLDLIHFPAFAPGLLYRGKAIVTVHDATFWKYPQTISKGGKYYYRPILNHSVSRINHFITVSESSKDDLIEHLGLSAEQITVVYEALDGDFDRLRSKQNNENSKYSTDKYILSVGTIEPRKNIQTLIKAFCILKQHYNINYKLILTGRNGWKDKLEIPADTLDNIIFTGYVSDVELLGLYKNASLYVFPSLYEGFGFPLLEAMSVGTPIVASLTSSLPEIGGSACIYVNDPLSADEYAKNIFEVLNDTTKQEIMIKSGYQRVEEFSWNKCVEKTLDIYKSVC
ncbi:glycosyltransferase family 4 protein [Pedobacter sp. AW1-32]|uniref:glycosyltransferase family 4 protein n=1 Tax=Pedobacter sp. AW1-32 TaxID=3383026 RepID=UPI003FEEBC72